MPSALIRLLRSPEGWAHLLLALVALLALADSVVIVAAAGFEGEKAAAGWFIGGIGLVLVTLTGSAVRQDLRGSQVSVMSELATNIIAEEEAAGREVEDHFQAELPMRSSQTIIRVLLLSAFLLLGWMIALPWLGFGATTSLFCLFFMRWVRRSRWGISLVTGAAVGTLLAVLFALVGVVLPTGALWYII